MSQQPGWRIAVAMTGLAVAGWWLVRGFGPPPAEDRPPPAAIAAPVPPPRLYPIR